MILYFGTARKSVFGRYPYEMPSAKRERAARLRNHVTGERQEVVLFDTIGETNEDLLAQDLQVELSIDVRNALKSFSPVERRIIIRVLVQGQAVKEATQNLRHSRRTWARWLKDEALPRLRAALGDYCENGKVVLS